MEYLKRDTLNVPKEFSFMAREWYSDDRNGSFHVYIFGCTENGKSVCLDVTNFTPYFYAKLPEHCTNVTHMKNTVRDKLKKMYNHLKSVKIHMKKDIDGFNNGRLFKFARFVFSSNKAFKTAQYIMRDHFPEYKLYETKGVPMITMTHIRDILMSGWIKVTCASANAVSRCQINATAHWKCISPLERMDIPPLLTLSFDIECFSHDGTFPVGSDGVIPVKNYITQIGNIVFNEKTKEYNKVIFVVGDCDPIDGAIVKVCKTESDIISEWVDFVCLADPDQIIGYNIDSFDWNYIWQRAEIWGLESKIGELSRLTHVPSEYKSSHLESNAFGYNSFDIITTPGIGQIDLIHWFRKNMKLSSYTLNSISQKFLGEKKDDVNHKQIFKWSGPKGTPTERCIVAKYCIQDTYLPIRLMQRFNILINLVEMSKVTRVPIEWLISRGESIKVYSQVSYTTRKKDYLIPAPPRYRAKQSFKGATVLDPKRGAYNEPVCGLDFASLYPSIMIAWNLCPTTFVKDKQYLNIPGVVYKTFKWEGGNFTFVQNKTGIISGILDTLWATRKEKKKLMAKARNEGNEDLAKIYNGAQLAVKVSMNSVYGDLGSDNSPLSCKPISACVTYNGRKMIDWSKLCAETWYNGAKNGYSDSLHSNEFVYVKNANGMEKRIKIQNLGKKWTTFKQYTLEDPHKEQGISIYKIKTKSGWSDINRVIRHKTSKKMFKIITENGSVCVTEDHGMILENGSVVLARNCKKDDVLMTVNY